MRNECNIIDMVIVKQDASKHPTGGTSSIDRNHGEMQKKSVI